MAEITYKGKSFEVDEDGFLLRFDDWCPEWMEYVKESEGISEINADHQKILDFLQDYYKKNGIAPMVRILSKNTGYKLKEVYELFPSGPGKGACKWPACPSPLAACSPAATFWKKRKGNLPLFFDHAVPAAAAPPVPCRAPRRGLPLRQYFVFSQKPGQCCPPFTPGQKNGIALP